jgi:hypothetical protein
MFEGGPIQVEDHEITLVRYLRYAMDGGGFLAFLPDSELNAKPLSDLAFLTKDLEPI